MTTEQRAAMREGRLDLRCRACGFTEAAGAYCTRCLSFDVEYRVHLPGPRPGTVGGERTVQWCQQGEARQPDPSDPRTGTPRAPRCRQQRENGTPPSAAVSEGLWA